MDDVVVPRGGHVVVPRGHVAVPRGQGVSGVARRLPAILVANKIDLVRRRLISFEGID